VIVFIRKSTLLCRQLVRRSMVFSAVQISMPGTSWARLSPDISRQGVKTKDAVSAIRPIINILIQGTSFFRKHFFSANIAFQQTFLAVNLLRVVA